MGTNSVYLEIDGDMTLVGRLQGNDSADTRFTYDASYLDLESAKPISISLPLQEDSFGVSQTRNFFEAMLPEGFSRQTLARNIHQDENDYMGILSIVGRECIGAVMIGDGANDLPNVYMPVDNEFIKSLAKEGASKSAEILSQTHLSLAGATGKVGLYLNEKDGTWFLPQGLAPSTHIVKQSHIRLSDIVVNEALCMNIARKCSIDTPDTFIFDSGGKNDSSILFVSKRFDRYIEDGKVHRLHQEDFSQALGLPANKKYEEAGGGYMSQMFRIVKEYCANPIEDQIKLFRMIAFNVLIGNTDAHLKNYSILYDKHLGHRRLAPAYDMLCTSYYNTTKSLSFSINGKYDISSIRRNDLLASAKECGMGQNIAGKVLDELCYGFEKAVKESCYELAMQGFNTAKEIAEKILAGCNIV